jgi:GH18 family chitinase
MHMMSYDQPGQHSTMEFAQKVGAQGAAILPPALLTLGVPFYGRHTRTVLPHGLQWGSLAVPPS